MGHDFGPLEHRHAPLGRRIGVLAIACGALTLAACGAHAPATHPSIQQRLEELAQKQARALEQIDELNNRLFILEDKVDTSRVALERSNQPIRLPVIRLRPGQPDEIRDLDQPAIKELGSEQASSPTEEGLRSSSLVEDRKVSFGGEARERSERPLLRLHGGDSRPRAALDLDAVGPDPANVTEKLPVVPLPKRAQSKKRASSPVPMREYQAALAEYRSGKAAVAAEAFESFVKRYAEHPYADNALYWLGECFYDMKKHRLALKLFRQVIERYPEGNKAPDALLKIAYCYLRLEEGQNARTVLAQVKQSYPNSKVALLASRALEKIQ